MPFRPDHWFHWQPFSRLVPAKGHRWQGWGTAFKGKNSQLRCTLLGYWGEEHQDPWLVLTDLAPECAEACWYDLRDWKEQIFKRSKRSDYWWLLSAGGEVEAQANFAKKERIMRNQLISQTGNNPDHNSQIGTGFRRFNADRRSAKQQLVSHPAEPLSCSAGWVGDG